MAGGRGAQFDGLLRTLEAIHSGNDADADDVLALRHCGLVIEGANGLSLPKDMAAWLQEPTREALARIFDARYLLFSETLAALTNGPFSYDELFEALRATYDVHWETKYPVASRVGWLEELGLCEAISWRKYRVTETGKGFLTGVLLVSPEATDFVDEEVELAPAPPAIATLIANINQTKRARSYKASPFFPGENPLESIRSAVEWAADRITKEQFVSECNASLGIGRSSVDSFLRPLLNYGLLEEVGRSLYEATSPAMEWLTSGDDLNVIRVLHSKARFVGELIESCKEKTVRSEVYRVGASYGVGAEYCKQFIKVLVSVGALEEPGYLRLRATAVGLRLLDTLPLAVPSVEDDTEDDSEGALSPDVTSPDVSDLVEKLIASSRDPKYGGAQSGYAFEEFVCQAFLNMGFSATHVGGSGDTDVLVKWTGPDGEFHSAVVDAKSRNDGALDHADISSALEQHKKKNNADHIAVIGFEFSGPTVREVAKERSIDLISTQELVDVMVAASELGIPTYQTGMLFGAASELGELIERERRSVSLIPQVVEAFNDNVDDEPGLSVRDVYLSLRKTKASPTKDELTEIVKLLSDPAIGALTVTSTSKDPQYTMYAVSDLKASSRRLATLSMSLARVRDDRTDR